MTDYQSPDDSTERKTHQEALNDRLSGGGCAEAWGVASRLREQADTAATPRRSVLRTAAVGAAALGGTLGVSGTGSAQTAATPAAADRGLPSETMASLADVHARDLLDLLADRGYLDAPDVEALAADRFEPLSAVTNQPDTAYYTVEPLHGPDGDVLRHEVVTPVAGDSYSMRVRIAPEEGHSYAVVEESGREDALVVNPDSDIMFDHPGTYAYTYCGTQCDQQCSFWGAFCETDYWLRFVCQEGDTYYTCGKHCTEQCG